MMIIVDPKKEKNALKEAKAYKIPVVALVDTNADPTEIDYPVVANDDTSQVVEYIMHQLLDAYAKTEKKEVKVEPKPVQKEEPKPVVKEEPEDLEQDDEEKVDTKEKTKVVKIPKYHVSQNKDEDSENFKKWRVRKEGSTKTIKFFDTQKEAIAFAEQLAESAGSSVVIHKMDGSIRKQDYTKKE